MGPLEKTVRAIDALQIQATLAVICGRNRGLKERLEAYNWKSKAFVYSFMREIPDFMRAADILVTKAGPGTISEAFIAGLPMILYSRMPGQEDGNVTYVVNQGAGIWAPHPVDAARAVCRWLEYPEERWRAAATCQRLARPQAARDIARSLVSILEKSPKII
jgi:1,2-diacylglycerol 3-beta-galactosyltransferase